MKLPTQRKILREDLKDAPPWIGPMIDILNNFMEAVYQALNRNLTFRENIASFIKDVVYITPSTYPAMGEISFLNELKTKASGVTVLQAVEKNSYVPAAGPVYVPWVENNGQIVVSPITGLAASKTYFIRLLVT